MSDFIWQPRGDYLNSKVQNFIDYHQLSSLNELVTKSIDNTQWFWDEALDFMGFEWQKKYSQLKDESQGMAWTKWFIDGELNIAQNCIDYHLDSNKPKLGIRDRAGSNSQALIWCDESGNCQKMTYGELFELSCRIATSLNHYGFKKGDSIAIYMPMTPELVAIFFACLRLSIIVIPIFSGYGSSAIAQRLNSAQAKAIFIQDISYRKGKKISLLEEARQALNLSPTIKNMIIVSKEITKNNLQNREIIFNDFLDIKTSTNYDVAITKAEDPSLYLYTSGTTGNPKACVHTHAGALAQIAKEHGFCFDVKKNDVFFWITDLGWMMGPWKIIGALFWGATVMLFEGAPNYPSSNQIFEIIDKHKVNVLGISPTLIRSLKGSSDLSLKNLDLTSLKFLGAAGEPFDEDSYMWFFEHVGQKRCPVINFSGGTEVIGGFLTPYPLIGCKPCSLGFRGLAMDASVYDENGNEVFNTVGHLVCRKPSPSMTKGFLNENEKYIDTYFSKFDNIWYHGDWAKVDEDGFWFLYGRSDDTIKIAGKRLGPTEVESILVSDEHVIEAAVIGVPDPIKGESIVCFIVVCQEFNEKETTFRLKKLLADELGSSFVPKEIKIVKALPKTRSGKIVRKTIKQKYLNQSTIDLSSIENPEALDYIIA